MILKGMFEMDKDEDGAVLLILYPFNSPALAFTFSESTLYDAVSERTFFPCVAALEALWEDEDDE